MECYQRWVGRRAAAGASVVVTVSEASKANIVHCLPVRPDRVVVTHEAARSLFRRLEDDRLVDDVLRRRGLSRPFLLALGSADPRKNVVALIDAYARLPEALRSSHELVIVWNYPPVPPQMTARADSLGVSDRIRFLLEVTDDELAPLYGSTAAFVHPSLEEGFGLPLLEAMACGAPVIAFDNSSIPEITGEAAVLVRTGATDELAKRMEEVLADERLRSELSAKGLARAREFSWDRCARETIAAYERAAGAPAASS